MANKTEVATKWADLAQRLASDPKLAKVLEEMDFSSIDTESEHRSRLRVPYANTSTVDTGSIWK